jgi:transposase
MTVVSNLETVEPLWMGRERKKETLDEFFRTQLSGKQRRGIAAVCTDMWKPYQLSLEEWAPQACLVYDKFHVLQHAQQAIDEVRRAEFFRQGGPKRELVKGKRWLLLSRWVNLEPGQKQQLNQLFSLNRRVMKAYLLKESLDRLWNYRYEGAMLKYLQSWIDQLRWQPPETLREVGGDVAGPRRGNSELLPDQGAAGSGGGRERQYQSPAAARPRLRQSALSTAEGTTHGRD